METADFLIIGAGIVGITISRELKRRFPDRKITIIEKESDCALHGSGRNSGVLHAGFYYTSDSLKAKFTRQGNQLITEYCEKHELKINKCGKLVVPSNEAELETLSELLKRGEANGVSLEKITAAQALKIEPKVKVFENAIFSPATSSVDPAEVTSHMLGEAQKEGIKVIYNSRYIKGTNSEITTSSGKFSAGYTINAGGLYADQIAQNYGYSNNYRVLPFKGIYLYGDYPVGFLKTHIYPVPDIKYPFLGVHFTIPVNGKVKIGPTAIPAFWREQYKGLENFRAGELAEILWRDLKLVLSSEFDFRGLALHELNKYRKSVMVSLASRLLNGISLEKFKHWGKPGIRAQLVDIRSMKLVNDFLLEGDGQSMHILNAVSPGFTCSIPFAGYVCDRIQKEMKTA